MGATANGFSPVDHIWARAAYFAQFYRDAEIEPEHLLMALAAEPVVRDVFRETKGFSDPGTPFVTAQALPLIDSMTTVAVRTVRDHGGIQSFWQSANLDPAKIDLLIGALVQEKVRGAISYEKDSGVLTFSGPLDFGGILTGLPNREPVRGALQAKGIPVQALTPILAVAEGKLPAVNPPIPGAAALAVPDAARLSAVMQSIRREAKYESGRRGGDQSYALHLLQAVFNHGTKKTVADSPTYRMLTGPACNLNADRIRGAADRLLSQKEKNRKRENPVAEAYEEFKWQGEVAKLKEYGEDLCALAAKNAGPRVTERDEEVDQLVRSLLRTNAFLVGHRGSGKKSIVRALADRIVAGDVPEPLKGKVLLEIDLKGAASNDGNTIATIVRLLEKNREIIPVFTNGEFLADNEYVLPIKLRASLQKGNLKFIGLTNPDSFTNVAKHPSLQSQFKIIRPRELSREQIAVILAREAERLEAKHGVSFSPEAMETVLLSASRYRQAKLARPGLDCAYLADVAAYVEADRSAGRPRNETGEKIVDAKDVGAALSADENAPEVDEVLALYCRDLTKLAQEGKLPPVIGRQKEIEQLSRGLALKDKSNVALIGDAGVGKTAIVEGLAQRINNHEVPHLEGKRILELDLTLVVAGTTYRGQFEERLSKIVAALSASKDEKGRNNNIVFIDEMHTILGAGSAEGTLDAANILKPALARGDITAIGATTPREYRNHFEKDEALARRFHKVTVPKPTDTEAKLILQGIRPSLEAFYQVHASDAFIDACVEFSNRYTKGKSNQPDIGKTLMNLAFARVQLSPQYPAGPDGFKEAPLAVLAAEVSDQRGISIGELSGGEPEDPEILIPAMKQEVMFQDAPIEALGNAVGMKRSGHADENKPTVIALFGKTGVGKTEIGFRQLAKLTHRPSMKLNMGAYKKETSVNRLIGSDPGYVDSDKGGVLTEFVKQNPYSVICLDEIEKAHPDVFALLLSVFEDGEVEDALGEKVDFKNVIFTLTSNIQLQKAKNNLGFRTDSGKVEKYSGDLLEEIIKASDGKFMPEFVNRLDEIVFVNDLPGKAQMAPILELMIDNLKTRRANRHLAMRISEGAIDYLLDKGGTHLQFGARPYKRVVEREVQRDLSKAAWKHAKAPGVDTYDPKVDTIVDIDVKPDRSSLTFKFSSAAAEQPRLGPAAVFNFKAGLLKPEGRKPANDDAPVPENVPALAI